MFKHHTVRREYRYLSRHHTTAQFEDSQTIIGTLSLVMPFQPSTILCIFTYSTGQNVVTLTWWRLNKYWPEKGWKHWLFMTEEESLINMRRIPIARRPKLQTTKNPFIDKDYFDWRMKYLRSLLTA